MNPLVEANWQRSREALHVAQYVLAVSPDTAASRAYYAVFYAVTALFLLEEKTFATHKGIEVAVHRDLVKTGRWPAELGKQFSRISDYRGIGDYGQGERISEEQARETIEAAGAMLAAVAQERPDVFALD